MLNSFALSQILAFLTVFLWSTAYVFTRVALEWFTPGSLGFLRCLAASLCLLALVAVRRVAPPPLRAVPLFMLSGLTGFTLYILFFNTGSASLLATTSCVLISTSPIITALLASVLFKERLSATRWAATLLAFCGILVMCLWDADFAVSEGFFWMLGAALLISVYNLLQRVLAPRFGALHVTAYSFFFGTLPLFAYAQQAVGEIAVAPAGGILLVCFLGAFPSAAAYVLWSKALGLAPRTGSVTNYMFLTPFLALLLEYAVTGDLPGAAVFAGGAMILGGLALFSLAGKRDADGK